MFLQLAENNNDMENYMPIETNQGTIFVRRDLAEDVMLSQRGSGRGLKIAAKVVGAAAKFVPLPGAAAIGGVASNILNKAGEARAGGGSAVLAGVKAGQAAGIGAKLRGALGKLKAKGAPVEATALPEAVVTRTAAPQDMELMQPKQTFFQKYRTPILIGGGVLVLGTAAYLLTRKKKR
jgi:hypothetical protein